MVYLRLLCDVEVFKFHLTFTLKEHVTDSYSVESAQYRALDGRRPQNHATLKSLFRLVYMAAEIKRRLN